MGASQIRSGPCITRGRWVVGEGFRLRSLVVAVDPVLSRGLLSKSRHFGKGEREMTLTIESTPYRWPYSGDLTPQNTALIIIDMQTDFCGKGGYVDQMGYDVSLSRACIEPISRLLTKMRGLGFLIIHTREGHRPDLSDLPPNKRWRSRQIGAGIGDEGPCGKVLIRGEPGWDIIDELKPLLGEPIIDKPGKGSFYATDLELLLHKSRIENIVLTGITTDVCVHTTMREANDRGFECVILSDCCAATDPNNHLAALAMVTMQGGVFGAVSDSQSLLSALGTLETM
jgi:nicotinamidase-related amidase